MIRIVIENILLFLLPTVVYVIYVAATRGDSRKGIFDEAPLAWLMLAGSVLVLAVLATYGSDTRGKPGQVYIPPTMKDGRIEPGRIE
jgi:hypothetical protein